MEVFLSIQIYNKNSVKEKLVNTDQFYSNKRVWLIRIIVEYIENMYNDE